MYVLVIRAADAEMISWRTNPLFAVAVKVDAEFSTPLGPVAVFATVIFDLVHADCVRSEPHRHSFVRCSSTLIPSASLTCTKVGEPLTVTVSDVPSILNVRAKPAATV